MKRTRREKNKMTQERQNNIKIISAKTTQKQKE